MNYKSFWMVVNEVEERATKKKKKKIERKMIDTLNQNHINALSFD